MNDPGKLLGDENCEVLTFIYAKENRKSLLKFGHELGGNPVPLEQLAAAALTSMILERYIVKPKSLVQN